MPEPDENEIVLDLNSTVAQYRFLSRMQAWGGGHFELTMLAASLANSDLAGVGAANSFASIPQFLIVLSAMRRK